MFTYTLVKPKVRGITHVILFDLRFSFVCPEPLPPSSFFYRKADTTKFSFHHMDDFREDSAVLKGTVKL